MFQKPKDGTIPVPAKYSWSEVWTAALTRPKQETYLELLSDPQAKLQRGALWMLGVAFLTAALLLIAGANSATTQADLAALAPELGGANIQSLLLTSLLCTLPVISVVAVGFFYGLVGLIHLIAQRLAPGGAQPQQFNQIGYTLSAIFAPMNLLSLLLIVIPLLGFLSLFLTFYQFYLMSLALRAVYKFELREALVTMFVPMLGFVLLFFFLTGF